ncbi:branched-chain amino acid transport system II carrier protein [Clostridium celatum]|uniref:branched-chain amino acid transport system II carrier protein n=1 Tax=Clostridium celatum TaxID=36834 RepID=UPI0018994B38|nr:branched-chain amino acid transport system II carrier protein [Clostridium celatum]MCE9654498.1 branched-chain amino acid transport system II carrier protein [Clostridium celatum]MDU6296394.1 branched-chain amino acid transport system II carrier protein [Clostridium celatum]
MKNLSKKDLLLVSLMLFSLFFGAGNLIFPPFLGQSAGNKTWVAMAGFLITAVGFPILGVVAVAKSNGLYNLAKKVNPIFALIFTTLIYLSIGPGLGIPRAGSLPFEMAVAPYLPQGMSRTLALFLFTLVFFAVAYWLSLSPSKLVDRMGKVLTPTLLFLIAIIFISSLFSPLGSYGNTATEYVANPFLKGFLEGYLTMDTIAALNFGIVISLTIKSRGIKDENSVISSSIKAGLMAGLLLIVIYSMLAHLGATSGNLYGSTSNGAETLTNVMSHIFGAPGLVLLAVVFTLACLTTSVGLITSCSQYFGSLTSRISYKNWVRILVLSSMSLANMGLNKILSISVPILNGIYPIAIMLIVLGILNKYFKDNSTIYKLTILFTGVVSFLDALSQLGLNIDFLNKLLYKLPLYSQGLCWLVPALIGLLLGVILCLFREKLSPSKLKSTLN